MGLRSDSILGCLRIEYFPILERGTSSFGLKIGYSQRSALASLIQLDSSRSLQTHNLTRLEDFSPVGFFYEVLLNTCSDAYRPFSANFS